jgi:hypothetical protein
MSKRIPDYKEAANLGVVRTMERYIQLTRNANLVNLKGNHGNGRLFLSTK